MKILIYAILIVSAVTIGKVAGANDCFPSDTQRASALESMKTGNFEVVETYMYLMRDCYLLSANKKYDRNRAISARKEKGLPVHPYLIDGMEKIYDSLGVDQQHKAARYSYELGSLSEIQLNDEEALAHYMDAHDSDPSNHTYLDAMTRLQLKLRDQEDHGQM